MAQIESLLDLSPRALGELKAWLEPWFTPRNTVNAAGGGSGSIVITDGVTTIDPATELSIDGGLTLVETSPGVGEITATGGGGGAEALVAFWSGPLPAVTGVGQTVVVPTDPDDADLNFEITILRARVESPSGSVPVSFRLYKSAGGGTFTPTTVGTVTVAASTYENETTGLSFAVSSGDLLRMNFLAVGPNSNFYFHALANIV